MHTGILSLDPMQRQTLLTFRDMLIEPNVLPINAKLWVLVYCAIINNCATLLYDFSGSVD